MDEIFFTFPFDFDFDRLCFFQIYSFYRVTKCLIFLCEGLPITLSLISFCSVEIPMTCSLVCFAHVAKLSKMFSDNIPKLSLFIYNARETGVHWTKIYFCLPCHHFSHYPNSEGWTQVNLVSSIKIKPVDWETKK